MTRTTIIIPSTCEIARRALLKRAVLSIANQSGEQAQILVVANGPRVDQRVIDDLQELQSLRIEFLDEGSLPRAIERGRALVATEFFGFLDDDDEYLPGALQVRLQEFDRNPDVDVVATSGFFRSAGVDRLSGIDAASVGADPLRSLLQKNWLASCSALYKSATVPLSLFHDVARYFEWTWLAFRLAATRRIAYVDVPTFRVDDTPGSLSKTDAYHVAQIAVLERIARTDLPADVVRELQRKIGDAHHNLSSSFLAHGKLSEAARHHIKSLSKPGGLRYLPYSRKLIVLAARY